MEGAKLGQNGLKMSSNYLHEHPKWSGISFGIQQDIAGKAGYGRIRQDTAGYGRIRQDMAGYGRIRQHSAGYTCYRNAVVLGKPYCMMGWPAEYSSAVALDLFYKKKRTTTLANVESLGGIHGTKNLAAAKWYFAFDTHKLNDAGGGG